MVVVSFVDVISAGGGTIGTRESAKGDTVEREGGIVGKKALLTYPVPYSRANAQTNKRREA